MKVIEEKVIEYRIETPIVTKTDVLVVGGGAAGIGAAVAANRNGAKVLLIEGSSYLGGTDTVGLMAQMEILMRAREGIAKEFIDRMVKLGGGGCK